jgi:HEAT repeat protein
VLELDVLDILVRDGDSPLGRSALRVLAEIDEERARATLSHALAGDGPFTALAIQSLARHGSKAQPYAVAAIGDPERRRSAVAVLGRLGTPACRARLRPLVIDPDPAMRRAVAAALHRCGERDGELWSAWLGRELDAAVLAVLAGVAGTGVDLIGGAIDRLAALAADAGGPAELRAGAAWAVAHHDLDRGARLADRLLASPEPAAALAAVVRRRGGPLAALVADHPGAPDPDAVADALGLPAAAARG